MALSLRCSGALLAALAGLALALPARANPIRSGFPTTDIPGNDDSSFGLVPLGFNANFLGTTHNGVYVNTNGNLTFDQGLQGFSPFNLSSTGRSIVAPFFADVDTSVGNVVNYGNLQVDGHNAFAVTWPGVGFYPSRTDLLNQFQAVLIDRSADTGHSGDFDIEFNYGRIQWETGGNSGGINGQGGASARVGYSNGSGLPGTSFELPGSGIPGSFLDNGPSSTALILNRLNSTEDGRYIFSCRNGQIDTDSPPPTIPPPVPEPGPGPVDSPEPGTLLLAGAGLALLAGFVVRRRKRCPAETDVPTTAAEG